jgi:hypothetical protein
MNRTSPQEVQKFAYDVLMPHQVQNVLLVASAYDSFILEEEGRFSDRLLSQYQELDLSGPPTFEHVSSARKALQQLRRERYDLVITTPHVSDMSPERLGREIAARHAGLPVVLLTYDRADAQSWGDGDGRPGIDNVFLWTGDPRLLLGVVKSIEDRKNVDHDTRHGLVRVIIVVEDSPAFYSSFLPIIYSELLDQTRRLLADRLNERDRNFRMRARPKILLARSYEEGRSLFRRYRENILGIISDVRFPRRGEVDDAAGIDFIRMVRRHSPDLPVLLQSRQAAHAELARELDVEFADKNSPELLAELREFMRSSFGFGPFVFRLADGAEVRRAETIQEVLEALKEVPDESLRYHASRNHISNWLMARGEFPLALEVRPKQVTDFATIGEMRAYVVETFAEFLEQRQRGQVTDFRGRPDPLRRDFLRLGRGSMGGKARSIAFMSHLKTNHPVLARYPEVKIIVPRTAVICTDVFDRFCARGNLRERAMEADSDVEVARLFLEQPLDFELMADLASYLREVRYPLAVRSSSLLEDSEFQPLAGLYHTYLLPNCADSDEVRLGQLARAVRLVFASTFFQAPRTCLEATSMRIEEEKMAVIVQRLVGRRHGERFYPHFAGVAQSHNYYSVGHMRPEDGIVAVALGLGHSIVGGDRGFRFSPRHPEVLPQMSSTGDAMRNSQRRFWALDLSRPDLEVSLDERANLVALDLEQAEADGTLEPVGATYSPDNDRIYDSIHRQGVRLVNFAGVLRHGRFPLATLLCDLLEMTREGMGTPLEMEFAVTLGEGAEPAEMAVLQLRPLMARGRRQEVDLESVAGRPCLLAGPALGNGVMEGIEDVVYVHPRRYRSAETVKLARAVARLNERLARQHRPYVLIGPGRWGTADRWLGIPVQWAQVSAARVIVEVASDARSEPSQGTHFFHNITSLRVGYFCITPADEGQFVDFEWLETLAPAEEIDGVRHVRLPAPVDAWLDGRSGQGRVLRREG